MFQMEPFPVKHPLDPWFVTGFCQGQASFTFSRSGEVLAVYFALKVGVVDGSILHEIQSFFGGIGRIYEVKTRKAPGAEREVQSLYYRVSKARQLRTVLDHFHRFPLMGNKAKQLEIWGELVGLKQRFRKPPISELRRLAEALTNARGVMKPF